MDHSSSLSPHALCSSFAHSLPSQPEATLLPAPSSPSRPPLRQGAGSLPACPCRKDSCPQARGSPGSSIPDPQRVGLGSLSILCFKGYLRMAEERWVSPSLPPHPQPGRLCQGCLPGWAPPRDPCAHGGTAEAEAWLSQRPAGPKSTGAVRAKGRVGTEPCRQRRRGRGRPGKDIIPRQARQQGQALGLGRRMDPAAPGSAAVPGTQSGLLPSPSNNGAFHGAAAPRPSGHLTKMLVFTKGAAALSRIPLCMNGSSASELPSAGDGSRAPAGAAFSEQPGRAS